MASNEASGARGQQGARSEQEFEVEKKGPAGDDGQRENHTFMIPVPSHNTLHAASSSGNHSDLEEPLLPAQQQPPVRADRVAIGMIWYGASSFFFAAMGICIKLLGQYEYPVWEITTIRAVIIMSCCLSILAHSGDNPLGNRRGLLLVRGTLGHISISCFFFACQYLPIADATTFTFFGPLVVAILSPFVLKEKLSAATIVVIPMCIGGVLLITQPTFLFGSNKSAKLPVLGVLLGLSQPFFSGGAKMTIRVLRTTEKTYVMIFYMMACTLVLSLIGCAFTWKQLVVPSTLPEFALLLAQGLCGFGNQTCITKGLANAKAASVMCMQYFSIVVSQLGGMLIFGEFTTWQADVGMVMVVTSMVIFLCWETLSDKLAKKRQELLQN